VRSNRLLLGLGIFLAFLMAAEQANAGAWCTTRNKCHWYAKKFTANAQVGCIGLSLPLCYQHSGNCDWTAHLSCGWRNCLWGGGDASADNGWGGCHTWTNRSGQGIAGTPKATQTRDDDQGGHDVLSHADFDDATRTVTITLDRGDITSLKGGMAGRFDVYVLREDVKEGQVPEGQEVDDPVPTPENTLWHGSIVLRDGQLTADGFKTDTVKVTTDEQGLSHATFENLQAVQSFDIPDADFANLVVRVAAEEE
jgi:hypothetical protein